MASVTCIDCDTDYPEFETVACVGCGSRMCEGCSAEDPRCTECVQEDFQSEQDDS